VKTPETDAAKIYVGTSRLQYVEADICAAIELERNELRSKLRIAETALASARGQLRKCQVDRERIHSQLRQRGGDSTPPETHG
jgi:hypothetical protein